MGVRRDESMGVRWYGGMMVWEYDGMMYGGMMYGMTLEYDGMGVW